LDSCFNIGSLNHRGTSSLPRQPSLVSTIIKSFTNHKPRLHFWTIETPRFFTYTKISTTTL